MRHISTTLVLLVAALSASAGAQATAQLPPGTNVVVHLADGSTMYGRLERADADSVVLVGPAGRVAIPRISVKELRNAGEAHRKDDGTTEYWFPNANTTRLFFGPTGRTLAKGQGYFADYDVAIGSVTYGLTDRITLGGGGFIVPSSNVWFLTPKVGIVRGDRVNVAAGAMWGGVGTDGTAGIGYLVGTFGSEDHNITAGVGRFFVKAKTVGDELFMVGGETRVSRRLSLVSENYFVTGNDPLVSYGVRVLGEKFSVDLAFFNVAGGGVGFPGIPYVDFVVRF